MNKSRIFTLSLQTENNITEIMESKYYTPSIEEFYVGFEYEYSSLGEEWNKEVIEGDLWSDESKMSYMPMCIRNTINNSHAGRVRVKYLDEEDVENLGFVHEGSFTFTNPLNISRIQFDGKKISILNDYPDGEYQLFSGIIKNKSELKRILKQLEIE